MLILESLFWIYISRETKGERKLSAWCEAWAHYDSLSCICMKQLVFETWQLSKGLCGGCEIHILGIDRIQDPWRIRIMKHGWKKRHRNLWSSAESGNFDLNSLGQWISLQKYPGLAISLLYQTEIVKQKQKKSIWLHWNPFYICWEVFYECSQVFCSANLLAYWASPIYTSLTLGYGQMRLWHTPSPGCSLCTSLRHNSRVLLHLQGCPSASNSPLSSAAWPLRTSWDVPGAHSLAWVAQCYWSHPALQAFSRSDCASEENYTIVWSCIQKRRIPKFCRPGLPVLSNTLESQFTLAKSGWKDNKMDLS